MNNNNMWDTANAVNLASLTKLKEIEMTTDDPEERKRLLRAWKKSLRRQKIITWSILFPACILAIIWCILTMKGLI